MGKATGRATRSSSQVYVWDETVAIPVLPANQVAIRTDLGPVLLGRSNARWVRAMNDREYLIKGPSLLPEHFYQAANEIICAKLAAEIGIPILRWTIAVDLDNGHRFFASERLPQGQFSPHLHEQLLGRCDNRDIIHRIVVFDTWVCNQDRTDANFLTVVPPQKGGAIQIRRLVPIDHGHCLVGRAKLPKELPDLLRTAPGRYVVPDYVRRAIVDPKQIDSAIAAIEGLPDSVLAEAIDAVPPELLPADGRPHYRDFLRARSSELRALFRGYPSHFPQMQGAVA